LEILMKTGLYPKRGQSSNAFIRFKYTFFLTNKRGGGRRSLTTGYLHFIGKYFSCVCRVLYSNLYRKVRMNKETNKKFLKSGKTLILKRKKRIKPLFCGYENFRIYISIQLFKRVDDIDIAQTFSDGKRFFYFYVFDIICLWKKKCLTYFILM
jgi:hypothetical protein